MIRFKDYIHLKDSKGLLVSQKEDKYANMLKHMQLTRMSDGKLWTGQYMMLRNQQTQGQLVVDIDDKNLNYNSAFAVTTNPLINFPCPRSMFKIEKYQTDKHLLPKKEVIDPSSVCYGDKIIFVAYDEMFKRPLYLYSSLITPLSYSRFSRNQEVLMNEEESYYNSWVIEHPDGSLRFSVLGNQVKIQDSFIIRHCATGKLLASDLVDYNNDYGHEYEVCCKDFLSTNKYQQIEAEKEGKLRIDTKLKIEMEQNIWNIIDRS